MVAHSIKINVIKTSSIECTVWERITGECFGEKFKEKSSRKKWKIKKKTKKKWENFAKWKNRR